MILVAIGFSFSLAVTYSQCDQLYVYTDTHTHIFVGMYVYRGSHIEFISTVFLGAFREAVCSVPTWVCVVSFAVSILHEDWCWKNKSLEVEVLEDDVSAIEFRQTGYMLR